MTVLPPGTVASRTEPAAVEELLHSLDGLEQRSLDLQVELLDGVRRGLDAALARPAEPTTEPTVGATIGAIRQSSSGHG